MRKTRGGEYQCRYRLRQWSEARWGNRGMDEDVLVEKNISHSYRLVVWPSTPPYGTLRFIEHFGVLPRTLSLQGSSSMLQTTSSPATASHRQTRVKKFGDKIVRTVRLRHDVSKSINNTLHTSNGLIVVIDH